MTNPFTHSARTMGAFVCTAPRGPSVVLAVAIAPLVGAAAFVGAFFQTKQQAEGEEASIN